jgi:Glutamyl-tRNA reductase
MELQLFGINDKNFVISEREKFIINESNQIILDNHLKRIFKNDFEYFFGISTCKRKEIYFVGKRGIIDEVFNEVLKILDLSDIFKNCFYFF